MPEAFSAPVRRRSGARHFHFLSLTRSAIEWMIFVPQSAESPMRRLNADRVHTATERVSRALMGIVLAALCVVAPIRDSAATIKHQASGIIQSHTPAELVLLKSVGKHQSKWDFVLTHDTQIPDGVNRGVRVTIYYHEDNGKRIADRVKVVAVTTTKKTN
jgi:hypothetical protein